MNDSGPINAVFEARVENGLFVSSKIAESTRSLANMLGSY